MVELDGVLGPDIEVGLTPQPFTEEVAKVVDVLGDGRGEADGVATPGRH